MIITFIILIVLLTISLFVNINLYRKITAHEENYEEADRYVSQLSKYIRKMKDQFSAAHKKMKEIDRKGAFESDDEVGYIFTEIKTIIEDLDKIV